jgi:hypothetical protein
MNGSLDFLLSPEEKSFLQAANKQLRPQVFTADGIFKSALEVHASTFPTIDYSFKNAPGVLHDIISLLSCHVREFAGSRA